ncbi:MAG: hypothetical protein ACYCS0_01350 [bacterium]
MNTQKRLKQKDISPAMQNALKGSIDTIIDYFAGKQPKANSEGKLSPRMKKNKLIEFEGNFINTGSISKITIFHETNVNDEEFWNIGFHLRRRGIKEWHTTAFSTKKEAVRFLREIL